jgi:hypothetical protein
VSNPNNVTVNSNGLFKDRFSLPLCSDQKFLTDPDTNVHCTGSLVTHDIIMTAAHCIPTAVCSDERFVFNYHRTSSTQLATIKSTDVFSCQQVLLHDSYNDYAFVRLDRSTIPPGSSGRADVAPVDKIGILPLGAPVASMGFGMGLPNKIKPFGSAVGSSPLSIATNLDIFHGDSGSGIYRTSNYRIYGILNRGLASDYTPRIGGNCYEAVTCTIEPCPTYGTAVPVHVAVSDFCRSYPNEGFCRRFYTSTPWTSSPQMFDDANGWNTDPTYWSSIRYPDLDGDKKADLCGRGSAGFWCSRSTGSSFPHPFFSSSPSFSDSQGWNTDPSRWKTLQFADLNNDQKDDVCGRDTNGMRCALSTGTGFAASSIWSPGGGFGNAFGYQNQPYYYETIRLVDLNNDKKADVCGRGSVGIQCALTNAAGTSFGGVSLWTSNFSDAHGWASAEEYWRTVQFADINGDGKADVCGRGGPGIYCATSSGTAFNSPTLWSNDNFGDVHGWNVHPSRWRTIQFPDVNGDGKADVCGRGSAGVYCALSNGSSFGASVLIANDYSDANGWGSQESYWSNIKFSDVNGDGKDDVCGRGGQGIYCAISLSNSSAIGFGKVSRWSPDFGDADGWSSHPSYWSTLQWVDVSGDGRVDLCGRGGDGPRCILADSE